MSKSYNQYKQYQSYNHSKTDYVPQCDWDTFPSPVEFITLILSFPDILKKAFDEQSHKDKIIAVIFLIVAVLIAVYMIVWAASIQNDIVQHSVT